MRNSLQLFIDGADSEMGGPARMRSIPGQFAFAAIQVRFIDLFVFRQLEPGRRGN